MRLLTTLLLAFSITACQSSKVVIDYDTKAEFSNIHTYAWLSDTSGSEQGFDPLLAERVQQAVAGRLQKMSVSPVNDAQKADVWVRYYIGNYTETRESNSRGSVGVGSFGGNTALGVSLSFPLGGERIVKQAQIMIDFVNPADQKLKWRGTNRFGIAEKDGPEQITAKVNAAVAEILDRYPPH